MERPPEFIDLPREELAELVDAVATDDAPQPFGVYALPSHSPGAELARRVEREVFLEFFDNSAAMLVEEYGPYEAASLFFCVVDHRRRVPAGMMRLILPSEAGFKSLHDLDRVWDQPADEVLARTGVVLDPQRTWDVATIAVTGDYRGEATNGLVSLALYQALAAGSLKCGIDWLVTVLDLVVLDLIQTSSGAPFSYFAGVEAMDYLDSPASIPVWCDLRGWERRVAETDETLHGVLCEGGGLEAALRPLDWDELVDLAGRVATQAEPVTPR